MNKDKTVLDSLLDSCFLYIEKNFDKNNKEYSYTVHSTDDRSIKIATIYIKNTDTHNIEIDSDAISMLSQNQSMPLKFIEDIFDIVRIIYIYY